MHPQNFSHLPGLNYYSLSFLTKFHRICTVFSFHESYPTKLTIRHRNTEPDSNSIIFSLKLQTNDRVIEIEIESTFTRNFGIESAVHRLGSHILRNAEKGCNYHLRMLFDNDGPTVGRTYDTQKPLNDEAGNLS